MSDWPFELIQDHSGRAIDRLTTLYDEATTLKHVIRLQTDRMQQIENVAYDLLTKRWIATASGEQLDRLGEIVGGPRRGRPDSDYRDQLNVRIGFNMSSGEPESVINLVDVLTNANNVKLKEYYPATISVQTDGDTIPQRLHESIKTVTPAGVALQLISIGEGVPFSFDAGTDTGGFGSAPNWTPPDLYPAFGLGADGYTLDEGYAGFSADGFSEGGVFWGANWGEENVTRQDDPGGLVAVAIVK